VLRPGGRLTFLVNGAILILCAPAEEGVPAGDRLFVPTSTCIASSTGDPAVEFHLGQGDWIRLLRESGFAVEELVEVRPPGGATTRFPFVTLDWARRWPCETVRELSVCPRAVAAVRRGAHARAYGPARAAARRRPCPPACGPQPNVRP
jgi:hypothetical protein